MNQAVATVDINQSLVELEGIRKVCETLMKTPHYAKMGHEGIFAVVSMARSLNIDPLDALNGALYFVRGRVGMATETMAKLVRQAGHSVTKDPKSNNSCCILHGKRKDTGDTWSVSFSIEDAKRAGIFQANGPWEKYPDVMCYNRCMSKLFRQLFPDLSKGAGYTLDELKEIATPVAIESAVEIVEEIPETFSESQVASLTDLFSKCEPGYLEKVVAHFKKSNPEIEALADFPADTYEKVHAAALKNYSKHNPLPDLAE